MGKLHLKNLYKFGISVVVISLLAFGLATSCRGLVDDGGGDSTSDAASDTTSDTTSDATSDTTGDTTSDATGDTTSGTSTDGTTMPSNGFVCEPGANAAYSGSEYSVILGPFLQMVGPRQFAVRWKTNKKTDSCLLVGYSADSTELAFSSSTTGLWHEVTANNLSPSTTYYYRIGNHQGILATNPNQWAQTYPSGTTNEPINIWVTGDPGFPDEGLAATRAAMDQHISRDQIDLWLLLGDNAYNYGTEQDWENNFLASFENFLKFKVPWMTLGNHDVYYIDPVAQTGAFFEYFTYPKQGEFGGEASGTEAYYSFDYENIHVVSMDSATANLQSSGAQKDWLIADLSANTKTWTLVILHHPPYTHGSHNSDHTGDSYGRMQIVRETFVPLFEQYDVDLVLTGHSHNYERSYPLKGHYGTSDTLTNSMIKINHSGNPNTDGAYTKSAPNEWVLYVVTGSAHWVTDRTSPLHPAMYTQKYTWGSVLLTIQGKQLDLKFVRDGGSVTDKFRIIKSY